MILVKYLSGYAPRPCSVHMACEIMNDGLHLPCVEFLGYETLCGAHNTGAEYEYVDGDRPTCENCVTIAKEIFSKYSKKQVNGWK